MLPFKPLFLATLEKAFERYFSFHENTENLLHSLNGKVIALTIEPFNETVFLCPNLQTIQCLDNFLAQPDTHISGSLFALGLIGFNAKPMRSVFSGDIKIEGNVDVGRQFQKLFQELHIDTEKLLAHYMGISAAQKLTFFLKSSKQWKQETFQTLQLNTSEFLQEETRDLPAISEIEHFYHHVDLLRSDFDRLQMRLQRLEQRITP